MRGHLDHLPGYLLFGREAALAQPLSCPSPSQSFTGKVDKALFLLVEVSTVLSSWPNYNCSITSGTLIIARI